MKETWTQLKKRLVDERGPECERCGEEATDLHHALIGRMKGKPELNVEENAQLLCKKCHSNVGGYAERCEFWKVQCERYGVEHIKAWYDGLDLKVKEILE